MYINSIIKHEKFMDVAIRLTRPVISSGPYYIIRGNWINQGFVNTYDIGYKASIKIKKEDKKDWLICLNPIAPCIRNEKWNRL